MDQFQAPPASAPMGQPLQVPMWNPLMPCVPFMDTNAFQTQLLELRWQVRKLCVCTPKKRGGDCCKRGASSWGEAGHPTHRGLCFVTLTASVQLDCCT